MTKAELRKLYKAKRNALRMEERLLLDESIINHLKALDWSTYDYLHVFLPIIKHNEPNIFPFLSWLKENFPNLKLVISKTEFEHGTMINYHWDDVILMEENQWGILEPKEGIIVDEKLIDAVLVPLLVADCDGHRVGYGKGFYDRFLAKCRKDIVTFGISYFLPIEKIDDVDEWDVSLKYCATPLRIYTYK